MPGKPLIVMAGRNLARLSEISLMLDPKEYAQIVAQTYAPLEYMMGSFRTRPSAAIIDMTGSEMIVEYHEAMQQNPSTRFVFLIDEMPPAAALAKASAAHGVFLSKDESPATIGATVVSLLRQGSGDQA
jgi:hypothetical protein